MSDKDSLVGVDPFLLAFAESISETGSDMEDTALAEAESVLLEDLEDDGVDAETARKYFGLDPF